GFQIQQRKWEKFTKPIQAVGHLMVKEFYSNACEPDKEKRKQYTYTSMVRGKDISFAPSNIKRVLKLRKDPIPGADWVRHKDGRPHYLRRADLEPMTKGWYEFICRSILPTTNHSELTVERAVLIQPLLNKNHLKNNHNPNSTISKISFQTSTLTLTPPCPKSIGGFTNNKKKIGRTLRPSTQE
ncbi:hypothetical protein PIB30_093577, partial [Stylosanthes scabra]|nr:hypothetical protein [Stylosanthes scabra]